jgi:hypothetical protein
VKVILLLLFGIVALGCGKQDLEDSAIIHQDFGKNEITTRSNNTSTERTHSVMLFENIPYIEGLGDTSAYVRSSNEVLFTGSDDKGDGQKGGQRDLVIYKTTPLGGVSEIRRFKLEEGHFHPDTGKKEYYCEAAAAEVLNYYPNEMILFQATYNGEKPCRVPAPTKECTHCDKPNFNSFEGVKLYYIVLPGKGSGKGFEDYGFKFYVNSVDSFFKKPTILQGKIDASLFCQETTTDCYFTYVYFANGNRIAMRPFNGHGASIGDAITVDFPENQTRQSIIEAPVIRKIIINNHTRYYLFYSTGSVLGQYGLNYRFTSVETDIRQNKINELFGHGIPGNHGTILNPVYDEKGNLILTHGHGDVFGLPNSGGQLDYYLTYSANGFVFNNSKETYYGIRPRNSYFKKLVFDEKGFIKIYENGGNRSIDLSWNNLGKEGEYEYSLDFTDLQGKAYFPCLQSGYLGTKTKVKYRETCTDVPLAIDLIKEVRLCAAKTSVKAEERWRTASGCTRLFAANIGPVLNGTLKFYLVRNLEGNIDREKSGLVSAK